MRKLYVKVGSGHVFVVLGAHGRVLTPINDCISMQTLLEISDVYYGKRIFILFFVFLFM